MDPTLENHLVYLQGRIVASELINRALLATVAEQSFSDPVAGIEQMKLDFLSTLQLGNRPADEYSDRVWAHAAEALNSTFDQVRKRLTRI